MQVFSSLVSPIARLFHPPTTANSVTAAALPVLKEVPPHPLFPDSRPYVRWWWLKGPYRPEDIEYQLKWLREMGFGGVEIAWIKPVWLEAQDDIPLSPGLPPLEKKLLLSVKIPQVLTYLSLAKRCTLCSDGGKLTTLWEETFWHCESCNQRGDGLDLVKNVRKCSREEGAKWLASLAKIQTVTGELLPEASLPWLSPEFSRYLAFTKEMAQKLGLGCDFTFGSCWPFGAASLAPEHRSHTFKGPSSEAIMENWEGEQIPVLNHLSKEALEAYFRSLIPAFGPALAKSESARVSALFCDSLEIEKDHLWNPDLWDIFQATFGYSLKDHLPHLPESVRYDWRKLVGKALLERFYAHFTELSHRSGALSRVQCHGAPMDLLSGYAAIDVPESEALLFPPFFSRIAASAGALAKRSVISCETFTCMYGFPNNHWKKENPEDLKLLADSLFANGVNQIIWHGMPYNGPSTHHEFYASVPVGPDSPMASELKSFNRYLTETSAILRQGDPWFGLAVYLPNEDRMMKGALPLAMQTPGAKDYWEMRDATIPEETRGFFPLWVSAPFLKTARFEHRRLLIGAQTVPALYLDVEWLDLEALKEIVRLVSEGLPLVLKQTPKEPGFRKTTEFQRFLNQLLASPRVYPSLERAALQPLIEGKDLPDCWARDIKGELICFFAHPAAKGLNYPMHLGQSEEASAKSVPVRLGGKELVLPFSRNSALLLHRAKDGKVSFLPL